ncbi:MAG: fibronectin type III domain-containing protein, partial [Saprospiraceae bacterium]|nr:fibronectin type III domain-containing protein [Saprospiraceae bacterium]
MTNKKIIFYLKCRLFSDNGSAVTSFGGVHSMVKTLNQLTTINFIQVKVFLFFILLFQGVLSIAQSPTVVLPSDGGSTQSSAPQGGFRYQRGFYLIQPKEMKTSGLVMNDVINCIGFTIGAAQSDTTKGSFKVYLQNTTDSVSRGDTAWVVLPNIMNNYYQANNLFPANYEWQIRSNCSPFSPIRNFTSLDLGDCLPPTHLTTTNIMPAGAMFNWVAPVTAVIKYYLEYKKSNSVQWIRDSTTTTSFSVGTLDPNSAYQWRVKSKCTSDSSDFEYFEFNTPEIDVCADPLAGSMMVVAVTDTLVKLKWTGVGADYYTLRWRRLGTMQWTNTLAFTDSITINYGLDTGTTYEWQIRSNCGLNSVGAFAQGPNFTTTGITACYFPEYFSLDSITATSVKFTWDTTGNGAMSYDIRYRAKDFISWTNAISPMVLVHQDSICIPDTIGPYYVPFEGMGISTFIYSGEGVYVAWEYQDSFGILSTLNSSLTTTAQTSLKGSMGQDSITYILSFATQGDSSATGLDSILTAIKHRPETRLCSPSLKDSVEVVTVYALGKNAPPYTSSPISAVIRNYSGFPTNYTVDLTVKNVLTNMVRYTASINVPIGADTIGLVEFTGWSPSNDLETDSIIISINGLPGENVLNNNRNFYIQMVTPNIVSYDDGSDNITQTGTDTAAGLTLSRHLMDGCGKINAVQIYLSRSSIGHSVYGIAVDTNKIILAQSNPFIPDSTQIDQYHTFYFSDTMRLLQNEKYYVGLAQTASPNGYFPVGVQYETQYIRDSAYFRGRINADSLWHQPYPGRLMIRAILIPGVAAPSITGDLFLCASTTDTLIASSVVARYADSVIAYSSQIGTSQFGAQEALGTPNVFPGYGPHPAAWLSETDTGREFLVLGYSNPDYINFVDVFETLNPGALDSIYLKNEMTGLFNLVWTGTASPAPQTSRKRRIKFPLTPYKVSGVRLAFNMAAVTGFSAIDAVCIGRLTTPGVFSSISWTGGGTNDTLLITVPGGYKLTTLDAMGCMGMDSVTIITPVQTTPVITAVGPTTICPGDSVLLKSSLSGNNIWSTGSTADSIYVKLAGAYTVMHDDGSGCGITMSLPFNITLFTPPVVTIAGDTVICPNNFITLKASLGFSTYLWSTSATSDSINVFIPGQYRVTV